MTTIAFDGRYISTDGRATAGNMIIGKVAKKLFEFEGTVGGVKRRVVFAGAGLYESINLVQGWLEGGGDVMSIDKDDEFPSIEKETFQGILISDDGQHIALEDGLIGMLSESPMIAGSGGPFAVAAMMCGKRADEAVKIACEIDTGSGGKIVCFDTQEWKWVEVI